MNERRSEHAGLLLIDVQQDYFAGGTFELDPAQRERAVEVAARLLAAARASGAPVVHVRHETLGTFPHFLRPGTPGVAFHPRVAPAGDEAVITKHAPNAFVGTPLGETLRQAGGRRWLVGGMIAWMCIDSTVRAGIEQGFELVVVPEMVASRALTWHGRDVDADSTRAAALAPLLFFAGEAAPDEAASLLAGSVA